MGLISGTGSPKRRLVPLAMPRSTSDRDAAEVPEEGDTGTEVGAKADGGPPVAGGEAPAGALEGAGATTPGPVTALPLGLPGSAGIPGGGLSSVAESLG